MLGNTVPGVSKVTTEASDSDLEKTEHTQLTDTQSLTFLKFQKSICWDLPGHPVVKTLPSNAGGWGFNPWSGN